MLMVAIWLKGQSLSCVFMTDLRTAILHPDAFSAIYMLQVVCSNFALSLSVRAKGSGKKLRIGTGPKIESLALCLSRLLLLPWRCIKTSAKYDARG